jgi:hypothetical protein
MGVESHLESEMRVGYFQGAWTLVESQYHFVDSKHCFQPTEGVGEGSWGEVRSSASRVRRMARSEGTSVLFSPLASLTFRQMMSMKKRRCFWQENIQ